LVAATAAVGPDADAAATGLDAAATGLDAAATGLDASATGLDAADAPEVADAASATATHPGTQSNAKARSRPEGRLKRRRIGFERRSVDSMEQRTVDSTLAAYTRTSAAPGNL
jgi:hypothetical protein